MYRDSCSPKLHLRDEVDLIDVQVSPLLESLLLDILLLLFMRVRA